MAEPSSFDTDWVAIERFVSDVQRKGELTDSVRGFMKGRLESPQEHIVIITLSVFDSLAVNCGTAVRDQLASSRWVKLLLEAFIANLAKPNVRDAIQQLFSNWRTILRGEQLGREARTVCKHMQSKNYVVPLATEYPPEVVQCVRTGKPSTSFVRGTDFMALQQQRTGEEADAGQDDIYAGGAGPAASDAENGATAGLSSVSAGPYGPPTTSALSPRAAAAGAGPAAAAVGMATGPGHSRSGSQHSRSGSHTRMPSLPRAPSPALGAGTDVQLLVARMERDVAELARATAACEAAASKGEDAALDECVAGAMEAAAKCGSWTDAIPEIIDNGVEEDGMMALMAAGDHISYALDRWEAMAKRLPRTIPGPTKSRPSSAEVREAARAASSSGGGKGTQQPPLGEALDTVPAPAGGFGRLRSGNPFMDTSIVGGRDASGAGAGPTGGAAAGVAAGAAATAGLAAGGVAVSSRGWDGDAATVAALQQQQQQQQAAAEEEAKDLRRQLAEEQAQASRLAGDNARLMQRVEQAERELQQAHEGSARLAAELKEVQAMLAKQQQALETLELAHRSNSNTAGNGSFVSTAPLLGAAGQWDSFSEVVRGSGSSAASLSRTVTRRSLASCDSFASASGKSRALAKLFSNVSTASSAAGAGDTTGRQGAGAGGGGESLPPLPPGVAEIGGADLSEAYRRMPALRVRFSPQHFANVVSAVSSEWAGEGPLSPPAAATQHA